ncbi:MAG: PKD domain-containing protein, partial [Acidobacteria bacterium]|nr:PKD domain-containing protein [Acidobacteriota bacterium]
MFDKDDRLHIASVWGQEILIMDPQNGKIIKRIGPEVGVGTPDDLAFGPDGSLYWTSLATGEVGRLTPDGKKTTQFIAPGVNPITFSDSGRLFVALCFLGDGLFELDPNLVNPPRKIPKDLPPDAGMLNGFDFGPDGFLYSPVPFMGIVVKIDVESGATSVVADGFTSPSAVKFDSRGRLHVLDAAAGTVTRIDTATLSKEVIARLGYAGWNNLAFDSRDRLYVSHCNDGSVIEILPSGKPRTISEGGMILPGGVAAVRRAGRESVFVADGWTLREFDALTGKAIGAEDSSFLPTGLLAPMTISADGSNFVMTSWISSAVEVWNPDTRQVLENYRDFAVPMNAIRFQGDLVVAELGSTPARVVRVTSTGRTELATGLGVPIGLAASGGDLWVSDWAIGAVFQIVDNGVALSKPRPVATGLKFPEGLAVDRDGSLLVVETGTGRLLRIDKGSTTVVAEGFEVGITLAPGIALPPTYLFNGVAVGPSGTIYVTGDRANVLYRLAPADNKPPVAVVKPQSATSPVREMVLDGSDSADPEGEPLAYSWKCTGKSAAMGKTDTAKPWVQFVGGSGEYSFELTVTDPKGASATAVATILYTGR